MSVNSDLSSLHPLPAVQLHAILQTYFSAWVGASTVVWALLLVSGFPFFFVEIFFYFENRIDGKQVSFSPQWRDNEHFHANLNKKSIFQLF